MEKRKQERQEEGQRKGQQKGKEEEKKETEEKQRKESQVSERVSLSILHSPHSHLPVLSLRLKHLIVVSSTLLQILPLLRIISRSISSLAHFCTYIRLTGHAVYLMEVIQLDHLC